MVGLNLQKDKLENSKNNVDAVIYNKSEGSVNQFQCRLNLCLINSISMIGMFLKFQGCSQMQVKKL